MNKMKICYILNDLTNGGAEAVVYNYVTHMNLYIYNICIITYAVSDLKCKQKFQDLGIKIYEVSPKRKKFFLSCIQIVRILKEENFDIVHAHMTEWNCIPLSLALFCRVKIRISHSHMAKSEQSFGQKLIFIFFKLLGKIVATDYFACGELAGENLFGKRNKRVVIIYNAIECERFRPNFEIRNTVRNELQIGSSFCIGNIARFVPQKNHMFILEVFSELIKIKEDSKLLLIGCGPMKQVIEQRIIATGLKNKVIILDTTNEIEKFYQAMDAYILPSLYEGLPVTCIEAQAASIDTIISDYITKEILLTQFIERMPIKVNQQSNAKNWAKRLSTINRTDRKIYVLENMLKEYDIVEASKKLEKIYTDLINKTIYTKCI